MPQNPPPKSPPPSPTNPTSQENFTENQTAHTAENLAESKEPRDLAPIVLFTYNRPRHTQQTLEALIANPLAKYSELFIYQDAPKDTATPAQSQAASEVSRYLQALLAENPTAGYFKSLHLIQRERNLGLADSIIDGVSHIINTYGKTIVLEDDIVSSPVFLHYMNAALTRYEKEARVWSIAGWGYPIDPSNLGDTYFWRVPHCWGWASWASRWQHFRRDLSLGEGFSPKDIHYINLNGAADFFSHYTLNRKGKLKTWAIFNYLTAYKQGALTLCPSTSYIRQIGFDNSGTHCGEEGERFNTAYINTKFPIEFPSEVLESSLALARIRAFELAQKKSFFQRALRKVARLVAPLWKTRRGGGSTQI